MSEKLKLIEGLKPIGTDDKLTPEEIAAIIFGCKVEDVEDKHIKLCGAPVFASNKGEIVFFEGELEDDYPMCEALEAELRKHGFVIDPSLNEGYMDADCMCGYAFMIEMEELGKVLSVFYIR